MENQIRQYINDVFYDLEQACAESGESLCAEGLADAVGDHMYDVSAEYRAMPYDQRRAMTIRITQQYV